MIDTLIILNPHAAGGRAGRVWHRIEPLIWERMGEFVLAVTQHPDDIGDHLHEAVAAGIYRIISVGGDGTNHSIINAIIHNDLSSAVIYGNLPIGTGRDWARSQGVPFNLGKAVDWIIQAQPQPTDVGQLIIDEDSTNPTYFLNIASTGLGGEVDARVNRVGQRRPWTFLKASVEAILGYQPQPIQVKIDGHSWFNAPSFITVIANGSTFGHGMQVAPNASVTDGLFDVIVLDELRRLRVLRLFPEIYQGTHLRHPFVRSQRAQQVEIETEAGPLGLDIDGEYMTGQHLFFSNQAGFINLLSDAR